jgi:hypothetical protein
MHINYDNCALAVFYIKRIILNLETDIEFKRYADGKYFFMLGDIDWMMEWAEHFIRNMFGDKKERTENYINEYLERPVGDKFCEISCRRAIANLKKMLLFIELDILCEEKEHKNRHAGIDIILDELEWAHIEIQKTYFTQGE